MTSKAANGLNVSRETYERLDTYVSLLLHWQKRINLIGPSTIEDVWQRHIGDSLQIGTIITANCRKTRPVLVDLGTGAGLPGIPLAISLGAFVHLVESNQKKAAFLREAVRVTGIDAKIHNCRIEDIDSDALHPQPHIVTSRALTSLEQLLEYSAPWVTKGAIGIFMKGQHVDKELTAATKCWNMDVEKVLSSENTVGTTLIVKNLQVKS